MSTQTLDYLEAVAHLPADGMLILPHLTWDDFEHLAAELGDRRDVRLSYRQGRMEITMPGPEHEEYVDLIQDLARLLVRELGLKLESRGTALLKREARATGAQPDGCFYVEHAAHIIGKRQIDLASDPPPDIVVEVDLSSDSLSKFPIYASLGVPEIWRYDGATFEIYHLSGADYSLSPVSRAFPFLTSAALADTLEQSKQSGQDAALENFRAWVEQHKP
jgi:Uma2 family endonuclease